MDEDLQIGSLEATEGARNQKSKKPVFRSTRRALRDLALARGARESKKSGEKRSGLRRNEKGSKSLQRIEWVIGQREGRLRFRIRIGRKDNWENPAVPTPRKSQKGGGRDLSLTGNAGSD